MELVRKAENALADLFKGAPKLSDSTQETVANIWPWLALIGGVLQLLAGLMLFNWARSTSALVDYANSLSTLYGGDPVVTSRWSIWIWASLAFIVVEAVLLLLAFPKLQKRLKSGWDLLFIVGLLNVIYAVVTVFSDYNGGVMSLLWNLLISAVIFWLLFAVRGKFTATGKTQTK